MVEKPCPWATGKEFQESPKLADPTPSSLPATTKPEQPERRHRRHRREVKEQLRGIRALAIKAEQELIANCVGEALDELMGTEVIGHSMTGLEQLAKITSLKCAASCLLNSRRQLAANTDFNVLRDYLSRRPVWIHSRSRATKA